MDIIIPSKKKIDLDHIHLPTKIAFSVEDGYQYDPQNPNQDFFSSNQNELLSRK